MRITWLPVCHFLCLSTDFCMCQSTSMQVRCWSENCFANFSTNLFHWIFIMISVKNRGEKQNIVSPRGSFPWLSCHSAMYITYNFKTASWNADQGKVAHNKHSTTFQIFWGGGVQNVFWNYFVYISRILFNNDARQISLNYVDKWPSTGNETWLWQCKAASIKQNMCFMQ